MLRFISMICFLGLSWSSFAAGAGTGTAWLKELPLDKAIRIGNGSHVVVEVSDPDCRFSRRMSRYWSMRKEKA